MWEYCSLIPVILGQYSRHVSVCKRIINYCFVFTQKKQKHSKVSHLGGALDVAAVVAAGGHKVLGPHKPTHAFKGYLKREKSRIAPLCDGMR